MSSKNSRLCFADWQNGFGANFREQPIVMEEVSRNMMIILTYLDRVVVIVILFAVISYWKLSE